MTSAEIIDRFDSMFSSIAGEPVETRLSDFNPALVIVKFSSEAGRDRVVRFHQEILRQAMQDAVAAAVAGIDAEIGRLTRARAALAERLTNS